MIDLQRFCATELDEREHLRQPWAHQGFMYATNGHILVRIPAPEAVDAVFAHKVAASAVKLFAEFPEIAHIKLPASELGDVCKICNGRGHIWTEACDECEGGEFRHGSHKYTCAECEGDGRIDSTQALGGEKTTCYSCYGKGHCSRRAPVGEAGFEAVYLGWIKALPNPLIASRQHDESAHFTFDGGEGLLMPMRRG